MAESADFAGAVNLDNPTSRRDRLFENMHRVFQEEQQSKCNPNQGPASCE